MKNCDFPKWEAKQRETILQKTQEKPGPNCGSFALIPKNFSWGKRKMILPSLH